MGVNNAIAWTLDWYRAYRDKKDMREVSLQQLTHYLRLASG